MAGLQEGLSAILQSCNPAILPSGRQSGGSSGHGPNRLRQSIEVDGLGDVRREARPGRPQTIVGVCPSGDRNGRRRGGEPRQQPIGEVEVRLTEGARREEHPHAADRTVAPGRPRHGSATAPGPADRGDAAADLHAGPPVAAPRHEPLGQRVRGADGRGPDLERDHPDRPAHHGGPRGGRRHGRDRGTGSASPTSASTCATRRSGTTT